MTDVPFIFGAVAATGLPGPVLLDLMGVLGHRESAVRNNLVKLTEMGQISATRQGRMSMYRLTGALEKYRAVAGAEPPPWNGSFSCLLYDVPERHRSARDRLRHSALMVGYGILRPGVLIAAEDRWPQIEAVVADLPAAGWVHRTTLTPASTAEAQELAVRAWDLTRIADAYRRAVSTAAKEPLPDVGPELVQHWRRLYDVFLAAQLEDPHLPTELLPDDWRRHHFLRVLQQVNATIGGLVVPYLRERAARLDPHGLAEFYDPLTVPQ